MKVIELTRNQVAIVDDDDFERLAQYRWYCSTKGYAVRTVYNGKDWKHPKSIRMASEVLPVREGYEVDHINGNKLDNRKCNLREADQHQQIWNRGPNKTNKLGVKGVYFAPPVGKNPKTAGGYTVRIGIGGGKNKTLGTFRTLGEATAAYNRAAIELRGSFARLN